MSNTLRGKRVSDSYQKLVQVIDNQYYDGSGNLLSFGATVTPYSLKFISSSYTIESSDIGRVIEASSISPILVTISSDNIPAGSQIILIAGGTGTVSVTGASGTNLYSAQNKRTLQYQYSTLTMIKKDSTSWYIFGGLV